MYYSLTDPPVYEGPKSQFDSLRTLLQSILECYQKGIYYFENFDGIILASKARLAIEVFIKNNPKSDSGNQNKLFTQLALHCVAETPAGK